MGNSQRWIEIIKARSLMCSQFFESPNIYIYIYTHIYIYIYIYMKKSEIFVNVMELWGYQINKIAKKTPS